jgi:hypothetical protein
MTQDCIAANDTITIRIRIPASKNVRCRLSERVKLPGSSSINDPRNDPNTAPAIPRRKKITASNAKNAIIPSGDNEVRAVGKLINIRGEIAKLRISETTRALTARLTSAKANARTKDTAIANHPTGNTGKGPNV